MPMKASAFSPSSVPVGTQAVETIAQSASSEELQKFLRGPKTLLMGPPGSGKTTSLVTYIEAGLTLFVHGTEPGFEESLLDAMIARNLPIEKLHYQYIPPKTENFASLRDIARTINTMDYEAIGKLKNGINKHDHQQFYNLLDGMTNFRCDRTGEEFGPVDEFDDTCAYALDSLTGLNKMVYGLFLGGKPTPHQGEWNVIMNFEQNFVDTFCSGIRCPAAMTCHVAKALDIQGVPMISVDALGGKLGPRLPTMFSDVPIAKRSPSGFFWSTNELNVDLKNRALPVADKLEPSFVQIIEVWNRRREFVKSLKKEEGVE